MSTPQSFTRYDDLDVFRRAYDLALQVHRSSLDWPKIEQYAGIADQIRRSSKSICANMAEGLSKDSSELDERKFLSIALGSCEETRLWSRFAQDLGYIDTPLASAWIEDCVRISQMLHGLRRKRGAST